MSRIPFEKIVYVPFNDERYAPDGKILHCGYDYKFFGILIYRTYGLPVSYIH